MRTWHISGAALAGIALVVSAAVPAHAASGVPVASAGVAVASKKPAPTATNSPNSRKPNKGRSKHAPTQPTPVASTSRPATAATVRTPALVKGTPRVGATTRTAVGGTSRPPASLQARQRRAPDVFQQAAGTVQSVFDRAGWNLLAIIPMAAIAFAISQRITSARRGRRPSK
jgi:hypothetical protein